jgi:mannosyltransferase OCH1-like enzyme
MKIPKVFHQIWLGNLPPHPLMLEWRERWQLLHPTWQFWVWTEASDPHVLTCGDESIFSGCWALLDAACHLAQRANMWRYQVVSRFGGIYLDTDLESLRPIDDLVDQAEAFVVPRYGHRHTIFESAFFGAIPGHRWTEELVRELPKQDPKISLSMGVDYLTSVTKRHPEVVVLSEEAILFKVPDDWAAAKREMRLPEVTLCPPFSNTRAIHHWSSLWYPSGFLPLSTKC